MCPRQPLMLAPLWFRHRQPCAQCRPEWAGAHSSRRIDLFESVMTDHPSSPPCLCPMRIRHPLCPCIADLRLCCQCGVPIALNPANMCVNCIRNQVDITEGIPKQITANFCKNCDRWLQPPNSWVPAQLESKELMALLLRKIKVGCQREWACILWCIQLTRPYTYTLAFSPRNMTGPQPSASRRRLFHLDGAAFASTQDEAHHSEGGFCLHHSPAGVPNRGCDGKHDVHRLQPPHGTEHVEHGCASASEG